MSTVGRTLSNLRKVGIKHGRLIGQDRAGNKFFENGEELPLRTRWVEYAKHDYDAAQIEPGWHAWISYSVDQPPTQDPLMVTGTRLFEKPHPQPNYTQTRGAFKTYSTTDLSVLGGCWTLTVMQDKAQVDGVGARRRAAGIKGWTRREETL
ncbi:putative NADH dehydrogenase [ubiquinone] 1 alpha subcomplex subunit 12 [Tolypocladium ophioglossoides CBS 100239]|uniref:NADH dehydrogenase [ubiquinone] 1 alpha subcomplex subunit n=1 Tax=Tolypocladium ophioglossoides (strain CBS 100239) TaxID=1163406 RepID=A0A0L0MXQ5_TOLOC|nr:putative NADH dehydrogenase [ubiquinone] 1 alpha subcomplex subunit 12 [Tolypocladium ophioglossoides CBS 100239]